MERLRKFKRGTALRLWQHLASPSIPQGRRTGSACLGNKFQLDGRINSASPVREKLSQSRHMMRRGLFYLRRGNRWVIRMRSIAWAWQRQGTRDRGSRVASVFAAPMGSASVPSAASSNCAILADTLDGTAPARVS